MKTKMRSAPTTLPLTLILASSLVQAASINLPASAIYGGKAKFMCLTAADK